MVWMSKLPVLFVCLLAFTVLVCPWNQSPRPGGLRWCLLPQTLFGSPVLPPGARLQKLVGSGVGMSSAETSFCRWRNSCVHHHDGGYHGRSRGIKGRYPDSYLRFRPKLISIIEANAKFRTLVIMLEGIKMLPMSIRRHVTFPV